MRDAFRRIAALLMTAVLLAGICPMGLAEAESTEGTGTEQTETTAVPEATEVPEAAAVPETTAVPEVTAVPEATAGPEATAEPTETPTDPDATAEPTETPTDPEAPADPDATAEPEATPEPDATAEPDNGIMTVAEAEAVSYYDPNDGQTKTVQAQVLDGAPEDILHLIGYYVIRGDVTVDRLVIDDDAYLILTDGSSLTVNAISSWGQFLTVWGQSEQTGVLHVKEDIFLDGAFGASFDGGTVLVDRNVNISNYVDVVGSTLEVAGELSTWNLQINASAVTIHKLTIRGGALQIGGGSVLIDEKNTSPTNYEGNAVAELIIPNPEGQPVTINGDVWKPAVHPGEGELYTWLRTDGTLYTVTVGEELLGTYWYNKDTGSFELYDGSVTTYYDPGAGMSKQVIARALTAETETMEEGWYLVSGDVTLKNSPAVNGNVDLILANGCSLTLNSGIQVGQSLTIWGQEKDSTGKVTASGAGISCYRMAINDGEITVTGRENGIHASEEMYISNAEVTAAGGSNSCLRSRHLVISDSVVTAASEEGPYGLVAAFMTIRRSQVTASGRDSGINTTTLDVSGGSEVTATGGARGIFTLWGAAVSGSTVTASGDHGIDVAQLDVNDGSKVTGTGRDLGIGCDDRPSWFTLNDGEVTATADGAVGLGALHGHVDITINGGTLTATGRDNGIGSISGGIGLNIHGGTVTATATDGNGFGIQSGNNIMNIDGGTVTAIGGTSGGVGIGARDYETRLNIGGGTVTATGGIVGIGNVSRNSTVNITGGTITADGGTVGIGSIPVKTTAAVTVTDGTIRATGGVTGLGTLYGHSEFTMESGALKAVGGTTGLGATTGGCIVKITGGTVTAVGTTDTGIRGGSHDIIIDGGSVKMEGRYAPFNRRPKNSSDQKVYALTIANPDSALTSDPGSNIVTIDGEPWSPVNHTAADENDTNLYVWLPAEEDQQRTVHVETAAGTEDFVYRFDAGRQQYVLLSAVYHVNYYDPLQGKMVEQQLARYVDSGTSLMSDSSGTGGWYAVNGDITRSIHVQGDVDLILMNNCHLTGVITVPEGSSLTIWGQNADYTQDGALTATVSSGRIFKAAIGGDERYSGGNSGPITINGGRITARGGEVSAGIGCARSGSNSSVTINGGAVYAASGGHAGDIGGGGRAGTVTITGGTVTAANGGVNGEAITITGGSVKGSMHIMPTDGKGTGLYLLQVPNPTGGDVVIGGRTWHPSSHRAVDPEDTDLYAWVPGADQTVTVGGEPKEYTFENGKFTCAADYDWDAGAWSWSGDNARATYTVPCTDTAKPSLTWTVTPAVTAEILPTCEQAGSRTYTAAVTVLGRTVTEEKTVTTGPATGHVWDYEGKTAKRTLSADGRTVTVYCLKDKTHAQSALLEDTEDTDAYVKPDCGTNTAGQRVYKRTYTIDGTEYEYDTLTVSIPAEHDWGPWETAAETETGVTYRRECNNCGREEVSSHLHRWVLPDDSAYGDTADVKWTLDQKNGDFHVTVKVTCAEPGCPDSPMVVVIGPDAFDPAEESYAATCTKEGQLVYQVTLTMPGDGPDGQVSKIYKSKPIPLPVVDHTWGTPAFTFTRPANSPLDPQESQTPGEYCTMTLTCAGCGRTVTVEADSITAEVTTPAGCETAGAATVTATASYEGVTYKSEAQPRTNPARGHDWASASVTWPAGVAASATVPAESLGNATVTFQCANDPSHKKEVKTPVTLAEQAPTCTAPGEKVYTADAASEAQKLHYTGGSAVFTTQVTVPARGHNWDLEGEEHPLTMGVDGDRTIVTAYCLNDDSHTRTTTATLTSARYKAATCVEDGEAVYNMIYCFDGVPYELEPGMTYTLPKCSHTWGDWEKQSDGTTYKRTCQVCGATETTTEELTYTFPETAQWEFAENGDVLSVTVPVTCNEDPTKNETLTYYRDAVTETGRTEPTCTAAGSVTYTVTASFNGQEHTYTETVTIPAEGHIWDIPSDDDVVWAEDRSTVTFTFECINGCGTTHTETADVIPVELVPADCETDGWIRYTAEVAFGGITAGAFLDEPVPAIGHDWDVEGEDFPLETGVAGDETTVTVFCRNDQSHTQTVIATLELVEDECLQATCTTPGKDVFEMAFTVEGNDGTLQRHTLEKVEYGIPAMGHLWGPDGECVRCHEKEGSETADGTWHLPEPDDTALVQWSQSSMGGRPYLTVTAVCVDDEGRIIETRNFVLSGDEIETVDKAPTCTEAGEIIYRAAVKLDGDEKTYELSQVRPARGHWWRLDGEPAWSEDDARVTFRFQCRWDSEHKDTVTVDAAYQVVVEPTCTEPGTALREAAAELGSTTASVNKTVEIPALGHNFVDGVCSRCGAKDSDYVPPTATPGTGAVAPDTGDDAAPLPWTAMLLACAGALVLLARRRRPAGGSR